MAHQDRQDQTADQAGILSLSRTCDEDIKASLAEYPDFKLANEEKDLIKLYKILQSINFSYRSNQEPILTMWNAKAETETT